MLVGQAHFGETGSGRKAGKHEGRSSEALAKAAASFCGDSSALATTPSKRASRGVTSAMLVFGSIWVFAATAFGAALCTAGFSRAILPSCAKLAAPVRAAGIALAEQRGL